ncbi:MAG: helix-turn-helix domain-containing protein [Bacteroidales bacterium]|nr:helix-turn-helix domain-containing protein [Candidatus Scybalousia scybalohippi]
MSEINKNFIVVHGWMVSDLKLKGNELFVYAIIYGFSQDGQTEYKGSLSYIEKWLNVSRHTAIDAIQNLLDKRLIVETYRPKQGKHETCRYMAPLDNLLEYAAKVK